MNYATKFDWDWKRVSFLVFLVLLTNVLSIFHLDAFGLRIHFFQYLIFLAALLYGPWAGILAGGLGSIYTALALHNPYVIIGNIILGLCFGIFAKKLPVVVAAVAAYVVQLPWLLFSDIYLMHMPVAVVEEIAIALLVGNVILAFVASISYKKIASFL